MIVALIFLFAGATVGLGAEVRVVRTPNGGIQPQAAIGKNGRLHLIYFKGEPIRGDVWYVSGASVDALSKPIRVNSAPRSVMAIGSIRGAHLAVDGEGRPHVAWMGSDQAQPRPKSGAPMLYTRLNAAGDAFEAQRNLVTWATGLDGGGSLAADRDGNVYVAWHAGPDGHDAGEGARGVFLAASRDGGKTFARERRVDEQKMGACGCCGMRAFAGESGRLALLYRSANGKSRDMTLLTSQDKGASFKSMIVGRWEIDTCPMSDSGLAESNDRLLVVTGRKGRIRLSGVPNSWKVGLAPINMPASKNARLPVVANNRKGETLLAWTEGTGWDRGGALVWQMTQGDRRASTEPKRIRGAIPVWGILSAVALPDGDFVLFH